MSVMEISEIRRANLERLVQDYGSLESLAEAADSSSSYLSQIRNSHRVMGSAFARKMEAALGLERGWFDSDKSHVEQIDSTPLEVALFRKLDRKQKEAVVALLRAFLRD